MKLYYIKGNSVDSKCKEIKLGNYIKVMSMIAITLTATHEIVNMMYLINVLNKSGTGTIIFNNPELTKLFLNSPLVESWVKNPNMINDIQEIIKNIGISMFMS